VYLCMYEYICIYIYNQSCDRSNNFNPYPYPYSYPYPYPYSYPYGWDRTELNRTKNTDLMSEESQRLTFTILYSAQSYNIRAYRTI